MCELKMLDVIRAVQIEQLYNHISLILQSTNEGTPDRNVSFVGVSSS